VDRSNPDPNSSFSSEPALLQAIKNKRSPRANSRELKCGIYSIYNGYGIGEKISCGVIGKDYP
jgi:hypothetical protein